MAYVELKVLEQVVEALRKAGEHLDYCNYGDPWENECATSAKLPEQITAALEAGDAAITLAGKEKQADLQDE